MNIQELRIGNLFRERDRRGRIVESGWFSKNGVSWVSSINKYGVNEISDMGSSGITKFKDMEPIPLTEEWLLKFGARNEGIAFKLKASALDITLRINSGHVYCEFGNVYLGDRIKHVHQLQNLYFALCGRELLIKSNLKKVSTK